MSFCHTRTHTHSVSHALMLMHPHTRAPTCQALEELGRRKLLLVGSVGVTCSMTLLASAYLTKPPVAEMVIGNGLCACTCLGSVRVPLVFCAYHLVHFVFANYVLCLCNQAATGCFSFAACWAMSFGPIGFVIASEMFPTSVRGKASGTVE